MKKNKKTKLMLQRGIREQKSWYIDGLQDISKIQKVQILLIINRNKQQYENNTIFEEMSHAHVLFSQIWCKYISFIDVFDLNG